MGQGDSLWQFFLDRRSELFYRTMEHLYLTGVSITIAIVVGLTLGIVLSRNKKWSRPVLGFANVIQTVPSIALLGLMIPLLGIGAVPAILALFLYALLPIIRNTFTGINDVDPAVREAGKGMGMSDWQLLSRVELPLALPVIFAGIRTATVINVGVATLCTLIGAGGLGEFIFTGINLNQNNLIILGAMAAASLAVSLDSLLGLIQRDVQRWIKPLLIGTGGLILGVLMYQLFFRSNFSTMTAGLDPEFAERSDGWIGLQDTYDMRISTVSMDAGLLYKAAREGDVSIISGYTTEGRIDIYDLLVLQDDQNYFPPYYVAPLFRQETLEQHAELKETANLLAGKIDDAAMRRMNRMVDLEKMDPKDVARNFLDSIGFQTEIVRKGKPDLIIAGKQFTEQYILAEIYMLLIENYTTLDVGLKAGLGGTKICFEALRKGEVDMYLEYTGTGLQVLINPGKEVVQTIIQDKDAVYEYVKDECETRFGLEWLAPLGFNNSYAMMIQKKYAEQYQLFSISDFAAFIREGKSFKE
ncbi:MAG: ABC transporter permease/substrate-binding protein [Bacteroidota bacterium]